MFNLKRQGTYLNLPGLNLVCANLKKKLWTVSCLSNLSPIVMHIWLKRFYFWWMPFVWEENISLMPFFWEKYPLFRRRSFFHLRCKCFPFANIAQTSPTFQFQMMMMTNIYLGETCERNMIQHLFNIFANISAHVCDDDKVKEMLWILIWSCHNCQGCKFNHSPILLNLISGTADD